MELVEVVEWKDRQAGDIGALRGSGAVSDAIIEGEILAGEAAHGDGRFHASHIFVVSTGHIFEAIFPRISLSPWNVYEGMPTRLYRIAAADSVKLAALLELQSKWVGRHYDLVGVIGMGCLELERHFAGHDIERNALASAHRRWCSELGTDYARMLLPADSAIDKATDPQQVVNYFDALADVSDSSSMPG